MSSNKGDMGGIDTDSIDTVPLTHLVLTHIGLTWILKYYDSRRDMGNIDTVDYPM